MVISVKQSVICKMIMNINLEKNTKLQSKEILTGSQYSGILHGQTSQKLKSTQEFSKSDHLKY